MCHLRHFADHIYAYQGRRAEAGGERATVEKSSRKAFVSFTRSETTWTGRPNKPKSNGGNQKATAQIGSVPF